MGVPHQRHSVYVDCVRHVRECMNVDDVCGLYKDVCM